MDDLQMEFVQSVQDVDYFLEHTEVHFSRVEKLRFKVEQYVCVCVCDCIFISVRFAAVRSCMWVCVEIIDHVLFMVCLFCAVIPI